MIDSVRIENLRSLRDTGFVKLKKLNILLGGNSSGKRTLLRSFPKDVKILHIAECAGGVERYLQMLLPRLEKRGLWQFFICSKNYNKQSYENMVDGVDQMDLKQTFSPLQVWKKVNAIRQVIKQIKPDIIYCHSSFAGGLGRIAAIGLHCKVVYNPHGWAFNIK